LFLKNNILNPGCRAFSVATHNLRKQLSDTAKENWKETFLGHTFQHFQYKYALMVKET